MASRSVLDAIVELASADPDHAAARDLDREVTFAELVEEAAHVAAGLQREGVNSGDRVALLLPNSVDFIVAALASLWIGAIFVPLAVTDPESRLATIVTDAQPSVVVTQRHAAATPPSSLSGEHLVPFDQLRDTTAAAMIGSDNPARVAYMIYTSGTTGTPKGVQIGIAAFVAAVRSTATALGLGAETRTLCVSPFHFDGSYANVFSTLISGGVIVIRPRDALLFPRTFFNTVAKEGITYAGFTPSYLRLLLASRQTPELAESTLATIALGGESTSVSDLQTLWSFAPRMRVFNRYGPTETTIAVTNFEVTSLAIDEGTVPIGSPHPEVTFVLVDESGEVIEGKNRVGELYIGGEQLMAGYWGDPTLTAAVMRSDIVAGVELYRTADLVYRNARGEYVYVDRADRVIKRSGVRISLVELSESMSRLEGVLAAACLPYNREGELGIIAFVVSDSAPSALDLRRAASKLIPENMLPDRFELVSVLPLNRSNMLDESGLLSALGLERYRAPTADA